MSDDWQETALTTRHMHNRVQDRHSNNKRRTSSSTFDVRKTFAWYTVKCPTWRKLSASATDGDDGDDDDDGHDDNNSKTSPRLELYRLAESGAGVVGYLRLPGAMDVAVVLAGSRVALRGIVEAVEGGDDDDDDDEDENVEEEEEEEEEEGGNKKDRFETFEKNSFRSPKFWVRWSGIVGDASSDSTSPSLGLEKKKMKKKEKKEKAKENGNGVVATGLGYIIFSGNTCAKFKGTLNCSELGWKDVAISGHKIAGRSESDVPVLWGNGVEL